MDGWSEGLVAGLALIFGYVLRLLYDRAKAPSLDILEVSGPFGIGIAPIISHGIDGDTYAAYRVVVHNREKSWLNAAADNCVAWLDLDGAPEPYQLSWVGAHDVVTINAGDRRQMDLCARNVNLGVIIAPTERGYSEPEPRLIGDGSQILKGKLRVTCRNGKKAEQDVVIRRRTDKSSGHLLLRIELQRCGRSAEERPAAQPAERSGPAPFPLKPFALGISFFFYSLILFSVADTEGASGFFAWTSFGLSILFLLAGLRRLFAPSLIHETLESIRRRRIVVWAAPTSLLVVGLAILASLTAHVLSLAEGLPRDRGVVLVITLTALGVAWFFVLLISHFGQMMAWRMANASPLRTKKVSVVVVAACVIVASLGIAKLTNADTSTGVIDAIIPGVFVIATALALLLGYLKRDTIRHVV